MSRRGRTDKVEVEECGGSVGGEGGKGMADLVQHQIGCH